MGYTIGQFYLISLCFAFVVSVYLAPRKKLMRQRKSVFVLTRIYNCASPTKPAFGNGGNEVVVFILFVTEKILSDFKVPCELLTWCAFFSHVL